MQLPLISRDSNSQIDTLYDSDFDFNYNYVLSESYLQNSSVSIYAFYSDLKYTYISEKPKAETYDLVSTLGGTLGLFLGISFLSFMEIVECFLEVIFVLFE